MANSNPFKNTRDQSMQNCLQCNLQPKTDKKFKSNCSFFLQGCHIVHRTSAFVNWLPLKMAGIVGY